MKSIFQIFILISFISCNSNNKSEKCTFNGVDAPCHEENSLSTGGANLYASVKTTVNITNDYFEFLENSEDVSRDTVNGVDIECQVVTYAGKLMHYKLSGDRLTFTESGEKITYDRQSGNKNSIQGTWINKREDEIGYNDTKIIIEGQTITLFNHCYFN